MCPSQTHTSCFLPLDLFPECCVPPAEGRTWLFMMRIWLQWPFGSFSSCYFLTYICESQRDTHGNIFLYGTSWPLSFSLSLSTPLCLSLIQHSNIVIQNWSLEDPLWHDDAYRCCICVTQYSDVSLGHSVMIYVLIYYMNTYCWNGRVSVEVTKTSLVCDFSLKAACLTSQSACFLSVMSAFGAWYSQIFPSCGIWNFQERCKMPFYHLLNAERDVQLYP